MGGGSSVAEDATDVVFVVSRDHTEILTIIQDMQYTKYCINLATTSPNPSLITPVFLFLTLKPGIYRAWGTVDPAEPPSLYLS